MENNMVGWFEIPVADMDRAHKFYEKVFNVSIDIHNLGDVIMGWFPNAPGKPGTNGSLIQHSKYTSSESYGVLIYFSCNDLAYELSRVETAGGAILQQKTEIGGGHGFMGLMKDTEGNRIALHSLE
jgi:hypothetical protein